MGKVWPDTSEFTSCLLQFFKAAGCAAGFRGAQPRESYPNELL